MPRVGSHQMFFSEMLNEKFMTSDERRKYMAKIKSKDTKPECLVRRFCRSFGYTGSSFIEETLLAAPIDV